MELYAIANLSVGNEPHRLPINQDPALSRLRTLKDAAADGTLKFRGDSPNAYATVSIEDFASFAEGAGIEDFRELATKWRADRKGKSRLRQIANKEKDDVRLRLARLRSAGVQLRNRTPNLDQIDVWIEEVEDWGPAVVMEIEKIDPADAEWFRTLDAVPPPRIRFANLSQEYSKSFRELDFMLLKLDRLLVKYSSISGVYLGESAR